MNIKIPQNVTMKMRIKHLFAAAVLLLAPVVLAGCEAQYGIWDYIRYSVNDQTCPKSKAAFVYEIPAEGGTYAISSVNYRSLFWPLKISEDDKMVWEGYYYNEIMENLVDMEMRVPGSWYDVAFNPFSHVLTVVVQPKPADAPARTLKFDIECGDAFGSFTIKQN